MKLAGTMLFMADFPAMTAFYRDVIGFPIVEESRLDDWIEFDTGRTRFSLHAIPAEAGVQPSPVPRETASCKLILMVDDLAAARSRLSAGGATIIDRPWGGWDFADPEGNVLGVQAAD